MHETFPDIPSLCRQNGAGLNITEEEEVLSQTVKREVRMVGRIFYVALQETTTKIQYD